MSEDEITIRINGIEFKVEGSDSFSISADDDNCCSVPINEIEQSRGHLYPKVIRRVILDKDGKRYVEDTL